MNSTLTEFEDWGQKMQRFSLKENLIKKGSKKPEGRLKMLVNSSVTTSKAVVDEVGPLATEYLRMAEARKSPKILSSCQNAIRRSGAISKQGSASA
jgi:hypothetical protein